METYNLVPVEIDLDKLQGDETKTIFEAFRLNQYTFDSSNEYHDAKLFQLKLNTSLYTTVMGYLEGTLDGVVYKTFVGIENRKKILEPFNDRPLKSSVNYLEYDTYYIFAFLELARNYSLTMSFFLSNDTVDVYKLYKILGIAGGGFLLVCVKCCVIYCCCKSKEKKAKKKKKDTFSTSCCEIFCCKSRKSKKKQKKFVITRGRNTLMSAGQLNGLDIRRSGRRPVDEDPLDVTRDRSIGPPSSKVIIDLPPRRHPEMNAEYWRNPNDNRQQARNGNLPDIPEVEN